MAQPYFVGSGEFRFYLTDDGALSPTGRPDSEDAGDLTVVIHMYQDGAHFYAGEVVVSSNATTSSDLPNRVVAEKHSHLTIDSRIWRAIPLGTLVDAVAKDLRGSAEEVARDIGDEYLKSSTALPMPTGKRGRRSPLTPDVLTRVVLPAYMTSPKRPVQAVREALDACAEFEGSSPTGEVTIDQARKAVARARRLGLLNKTTKGARS